MAASKPTDGQTDVHMRLCNVVPLVWGSLGLTLPWLLRDISNAPLWGTQACTGCLKTENSVKLGTLESQLL